MPYIKQEDRLKFVLPLSNIPNFETAGELNYFLSSVVVKHLKTLDKIGYAELNTIDGVLGQVQNEFRRRVVAKYEDSKILENSDIYQDIVK